jgi:hypothetical protein
MLASARQFRVHGVPLAVERFLAERGINVARSAIVSATTESYLLGFEFGFAGLLVTEQHQFFEFEVEANEDMSRVLFVHEFMNVSERQNTSRHNKGTGLGDGAIAIMVLAALNTDEVEPRR